MAPQESCFQGDSAHPNQLLSVYCTQQIFSFQHYLTVSLKLGIGSPEIGAAWDLGKATGNLSPRRCSRAGGDGTHQLGAFISAVPREDEVILSRGNGHHWRVHQAQLHDSGVVGTQGGRVVQPDPRGVTATWGARGQGQVTAGTRARGEKHRQVKNDAVLPWGGSRSQLPSSV